MKKAWIFVIPIVLLVLFTTTMNVMAGSAGPVALRRTPDRTPRIEPTRLSTPDYPGGGGDHHGPGGGNDQHPGGGNSQGNEQRNYQGSIAAVDTASLTLTLKDGSSLTFVLNADTRVKIPGLGHDATVADLKTGEDATVRASKDSSGALVASMVEVKLAKPVLEHYTGTVTDYQPGSSITIQDKHGAALTFLITPDTRINTGPKNYGAQLAVGSMVAIVALRDPAGGTPTAREIAVFPQKKPEKPQNYMGIIAAVDAGSLNLTLKDGSSLTFVLNADTRVKIPSLGHDATIADLKVGEEVIVRAMKDSTGSLVASMILLIPGKPEKIHRVGTVTDYQPGVSITIQDKDGNLFTFLITPQTKILPPDLAGTLGVGSRVTIIAPRDVAHGTLTALGIVVHPAGSGGTGMPTSTPTATDTPTATETATSTETATP